MHLHFEWTFWIAGAASIVALGKFADEYHITKTSKSLARDFLIRRFLALDNWSVPNLASLATDRIVGILHGNFRRLVVVSVPTVYLSTVTVFYFGRKWAGDPYEGGYFRYLITWLPLELSSIVWLLLTLCLVGLGLLCLNVFRSSLSSLTPNASALQITVICLKILAITIFLCIPLYVAIPLLILVTIGFGMGSGGLTSPIQHPFFGVVLIGIVVVPIAFTTIIVFILILLKLAIEIIRRTLLSVFDSATDPETSPYTYLAALLGLGVLILGLGKALFEG